MLTEKPFKAMSGWMGLLISLLILVTALVLFVSNVAARNAGGQLSILQLMLSIGLLVVLCGTAHTQPVINTGSLYN